MRLAIGEALSQTTPTQKPNWSTFARPVATRIIYRPERLSKEQAHGPDKRAELFMTGTSRTVRLRLKSDSSSPGCSRFPAELGPCFCKAARVIGFRSPRSTLGFTGRLTVMPLGLDQIALVTIHVGLIRECNDTIGVVAAQRALNAVGVGYANSSASSKQLEFPQDSAQEVNRPQRVGVLRLQYTAPVVDVFPEHGFGKVGLADMPENRAEPFGGFKCDRIGRAETAAPSQDSARASVSASRPRPVRSSNKAIRLLRANRITVPRTVKLRSSRRAAST